MDSSPHRIVIKLGTGLLTEAGGTGLDVRQFRRLTYEVADLVQHPDLTGHTYLVGVLPEQAGADSMEGADPGLVEGAPADNKQTAIADAAALEAARPEPCCTAASPILFAKVGTSRPSTRDGPRYTCRSLRSAGAGALLPSRTWWA